MRVLITGGNGDLAYFLSDKLRDIGYIVDSPSRLELDVSQPSSVEMFFKDKKYDVVINAAGTLYSSLIADSDPLLWVKDIEVNLIGTYLVSRMAIKVNENVKLFNVGSTAAFNNYKDWTSYCAAKAGVVTLSKGLHLDGYNINVFCPGAIETKLRSSLNINNPNVMTIEEGASPILRALFEGESGKLYFYRKHEYREESLSN